MPLLIAFFTAILSLFVIQPASAADIEGAADHPRIPRLPHYEIVDYTAGDFGAHDFYKSEEEMVSVEGRIWRIDYQLAEGAKGKAALEVARNYEQALKSKGGGTYEEGIDISGGRAYAWMTEDNGAETWMEIEVSNGGEYYVLTIVETAPLKQAIEIGADEMAKALQDEGTIALYGILFDTAKADIRPESEKTIAAIAGALNALPAMAVEIGGHTDNVGAQDYNQQLSEARAQAVRDALIAKGISAERLTAKGYGLSMPVDSNDTEEGRAKNRRVQLTRIGG